MKKMLIAAVVVGGLLLTGCSTTDDPKFDETTVQYDGRDLDCITWTGSHGEVGLACDFVKYHKEAK